jgi:hypothetical protein
MKKQTNTKGYKVIGYSRRSCRAMHWDEKLLWAVHYPVGKEAFPKRKGTKLFFFKDRACAEDFAIGDEMIVPCIATNAVKTKWIVGRGMDLEDFWDKRHKCKDKSEAIEGTWLAESITCLE